MTKRILQSVLGLIVGLVAFPIVGVCVVLWCLTAPVVLAWTCWVEHCWPWVWFSRCQQENTAFSDAKATIDATELEPT